MEPTRNKPTTEGLYWVWDKNDWYMIVIVPTLLMSGKTRLVALSVFSPGSDDNTYCELDCFEWFIGPMVKPPPPPTKDAE